MYCYFTFRSITPAQQGLRALQKAGVGAQLMRTPGQLPGTGCSYAIRVRGGAGSQAAAALREAGAPYQAAFVWQEGDRPREAAL